MIELKEDSSFLLKELNYILEQVSSDEFLEIPLKYIEMAMMDYVSSINSKTDIDVAGLNLETLATYIEYNALKKKCIVTNHPGIIEVYKLYKINFTISGGKRVHPISKIILKFKESKITKDEARVAFKKLLVSKIKYNIKKTIVEINKHIINQEYQEPIFLEDEYFQDYQTVQDIFDEVDRNYYGYRGNELLNIYKASSISVEAMNKSIKNLNIILKKNRKVKDFDIKKFWLLLKTYNYYNRTFNNVTIDKEIFSLFNKAELIIIDKENERFNFDDSLENVFNNGNIALLFSIEHLIESGNLDFEPLDVKVLQDKQKHWSEIKEELKSIDVYNMSNKLKELFFKIQELSNTKENYPKVCYVNYVLN